jgi:hypothetical protein
MGLINIAWIADPRATTFCALCVFFVLLRTGKDIYRHWQYRNTFSLHTKYLRIISIMIMVPLYAILSFLSLLFSAYTVYFDIIRDSYEGFALYECFCLYVDFLGYSVIDNTRSTQTVKKLLEEHNTSIYHSWILKQICKNDWLKDNLYNNRTWIKVNMYEKCKYCILQYCILKPIISLISCILYYNDLFTYANFQITKNAYCSLLIISFVSIGIAFYFFGIFCSSLQNELKKYNPLKKFLCIKIIILFSFWQESFFDLLIGADILDAGNETKEYIIATIHDFVMCIELVPFAIFHHHVFGYKSILKEFNAKENNNSHIDKETNISIFEKYKNIIIFEISHFFKSYKTDVAYIFVGLIFSFIYALLGQSNFNIQNNGLAYMNYAISIAMFSDTNNTYPTTSLGELAVMSQRIINFVMIILAIKDCVKKIFTFFENINKKFTMNKKIINKCNNIKKIMIGIANVAKLYSKKVNLKKNIKLKIKGKKTV